MRTSNRTIGIALAGIIVGMAGLAFASAYATPQLIGLLSEFWGTVLALLVGVGLFVFGFYALTRRERLQQWATTCETQWKSWLAWR